MSKTISSPSAALDWASKRCARRECCRSEIAHHLRNTSLEADTIEEILNTLESEGYIDHSRYAHAFVHDKLHFDRWGRLKITQALRLKGIDHADIKTALADEWVEKDYRDTLSQLLLSKFQSLRFDPKDRRAAYQASQKLLRFAASRGYEAEYIFDEIDHLGLHE